MRHEIILRPDVHLLYILSVIVYHDSLQNGLVHFNFCIYVMYELCTFGETLIN